MSLLLARGLQLGGIQTFPTPSTSWSPCSGGSTLWSSPESHHSIHPGTPSSLPPFPWGHKISPEQFPCALGLGCECNPAGGSACVSIDCLRKGRLSVSEVPAQQGNLTWYQKIQYRAVEGKDEHNRNNSSGGSLNPEYLCP